MGTTAPTILLVPDASLETNQEVALPAPAAGSPRTASENGPSSEQRAQTLAAAPPLRPGQLTVAWQIMLSAAWTAAFFACASVWKTSAEIGIGTWWIGPRAQPQHVLVRILPFAVTMLLGLLAVYNVRRVAVASIAASLLLAGGAVFDMSRSGGLAAIEFAIAGSMLLVSVGALAASTRRAPHPATAP